MVDPGFEHAGQRVEPGAARRQVDDRVVACLAVPIDRGVVRIEHIELDHARWRLRLGEQPAEVAEAAGRGVHLDDLLIGGEHRTLVQRDDLRPEQQLAGVIGKGLRHVAVHGETAHAQRLGAVEQTAQRGVHQLVDEQRRYVDARRHEEPQIAVLDDAGGDQAVAEIEHHAIVLARVRIGQRGQTLGRDRLARIVDQRGVQRALGVAGFVDRREFWPRDVGAQEVVGDGELAVVAPRQQVIAGIAPEIGHRETGPWSCGARAGHRDGSRSPTASPWRGAK